MRFSNMALVALFVGSAASSQAQVLTSYTQESAFAAAAGTTTLVNFDSFASGTQITTNLAGVGISSVTGTSTNAAVPGAVKVFVTSSANLPFPMFTRGTLPSEPNFLSNDLSAAGGYATGTITFAFSQPHFAVGAYDADGSPIQGFSIQLFNGVQSLGTITVGPRTLPDSFVGVTSDTAFTSATFFAVNPFDSYGLDNLEFNRVAAVPEPGSVAVLIGCTTTGAGFLARRRRQARHAA